jgi:hypothetical protein
VLGVLDNLYGRDVSERMLSMIQSDDAVRTDTLLKMAADEAFKRGALSDETKEWLGYPTDEDKGIEKTPVSESRPTSSQQQPQQQQPSRNTIAGFRANVPEQEASKMRSGGMAGAVTGAGDARAVDYLSQANAAAREGVYLENGLRKSQGVENVNVPLNTETLTTVFGGVEVPQGAPAKKTAIALKEAVAQYDQEAADFFGKETKYLRTGSEEQWAEYDKKAKEHFGVDGQTLFSIRNQMFDNVEKGRPIDYMPPENERDQWWWTGKEMPVVAKMRELTTIEEPTAEDVVAAAEDINTLDPADSTEQELQYVGEAEDIASRTFLEDVSNGQTVSFGLLFKNSLKKANLPEDAKAPVSDYLGKLAKPGLFVDWNSLLRSDPKGARAVSKYVKSNSETISGAMRAADKAIQSTAARLGSNKADGQNSGAAGEEKPKSLIETREYESAVERFNRITGYASEGQALKDMAFIQSARFEQLVREFQREGTDGLSPMTERHLPETAFQRRQQIAARDLRRERFEEAKDQFKAQQELRDEQLDLQKRRVALAERGMDLKETASERAGYNYKDVVDVGIALQESRASLMEWQAELYKEQLEGEKGEALSEEQIGGAMAVEAMTENRRIIDSMEESLWEKAENDPETFARLKEKALRDDELYRSAHDALIIALGTITGKAPKMVRQIIEAQKGQPLRNFWRGMFGSNDFVKKEEESSYWRLQLTPTVSSGEDNETSNDTTAPPSEGATLGRGLADGYTGK